MAGAPPSSDTAFGEALQRVAPALRSYARSLTRNAEDVEDLIQDTLLRAWSARDRFQVETNLKAWTRTILHNRFITEWRRKRYSGEWDEQLADEELASPAAQPGHVALSDALVALETIPLKQREAVMLMGYEGLSLEEIAHITGALLAP